METRYHLCWPARVLTGSLMALLGITPVIAQSANFGEFTLATDAANATANGYTAGSAALSDIAARDRYGKICVGFANTNPDHIMRLEQDFSHLTVQINSSGNDTTLLIQGPDNGTIRCGGDIDRRNLDAQIQDESWTAGTYRIWVGSHNQGQRYDYLLRVTP
jgi:hypothetical protein